MIWERRWSPDKIKKISFIGSKWSFNHFKGHAKSNITMGFFFSCFVFRENLLWISSSHSAESAFYNPTPLYHSLSISLSYVLFTEREENITFPPGCPLVHCLLLISNHRYPTSPPASVSLQPRWTEDRATAREHPSSIRSDPPSQPPLPSPPSLPQLRSLHFPVLWDVEHIQSALCSLSRPGVERQEGLPFPGQSREVKITPAVSVITLEEWWQRNGTVRPPDRATHWSILASISVHFRECKAISVFSRLLLTPDVDPGWHWIVFGRKMLKGFRCGLECWWGAPKLWDAELRNRSIWTCLASPKSQNSPGECMHEFLKHF